LGICCTTFCTANPQQIEQVEFELQQTQETSLVPFG
jgi:hypothetical protein